MTAPINSPEAADHASAAPEFGLVDLVDAFTAMRHEWRNQSREGRQLTEAIQSTSAQLQEIEQKLDKKLSTALDDSRLKSLLAIVIDVDISLRRAVAAATAERVRANKNRTGEQLQFKQRLRDSIAADYRQLGAVRRLFAKKFFQQTLEKIDTASGGDRQDVDTDATIDGLRIILTRLQTMMDEQHLTRVESLGKPFDGQSMNAISSVTTTAYAPGTVAEEISSSYYYQSQLVRYAEVRVAAADS